MKNLKFHSLLNYKKDVLEKKLSSIELINLLVHKKVLVKSNLDKSENVKSLNRLHSPSDGKDHLIFATIIFDKATYFLSDDFIEEAVDFILQHTKKTGEKLLSEKRKEYTIRNDGFLNINQKKEFFNKELDIQIGKKITLTKYFEIEDYNEDEGAFSQKIKDHLKYDLHSNSDFNSRYVYGFNALNKIDLSVYFDNLEELVYVQRLIDTIKFEIKQKDLKISNGISFTTQEAMSFFEIIGLLKPNEEISYRKQAELISKILGKSPDNIRKVLSKFESKDSKDKASLRSTESDIKSFLKELGYPLGGPQ
jgi:hypothetical protein